MTFIFEITYLKTMKTKFTLQEYIEVLNLTQEQAAMEIGVSRTYLNLVLSGRKPAGRQFCLKVGKWSRGLVDILPLLNFQPEVKAA